MYSPAVWIAILSLLVALASLGMMGRLMVRNRREEEGLRSQSLYLDELFASSDEPTVLVNDTGYVVRTNEAFQHLFSLSTDDLRDVRLTQLLRDDSEAETADRLMHAVAGDPVQYRTRCRDGKGAELEVSVMGGPVRIPGDDARAFFIIRDGTRQTLVDAAFRRLEKALDTMQIGVTITDTGGRIVYTNPADAAMHGYSPRELIGRHARVLAPRRTHRPLRPGKVQEMRAWRRESVNVRRDGTSFPVQLMSDLVRDADGRPLGVVTTCEDITQRKMAERSLRESEERYALALRGTRDGLWDWNLETNEVFYSTRWLEMLGLEREEVAHSLEAWLERVAPEDRPDLEAALAAHRSDRTDRFEHEHRIRHEDGRWLWALARGIAERDPEGRPYRITGVMTDITDRKEMEEQLAQGALYDPLTGLPNRAYLNDLLDRSVQRAQRRRDYQFAVLFLDLDRFKQVNDALGHQAGDELLMEVAARLETCVRPGDVVTRLGGDEFCILVDEIHDDRDATRVARRIIESLHRPFSIRDQTVRTGVSVGIAVADPEVSEPGDLIRNADTAMYRAKAAGKGRIEVYDRKMQDRAVTMLKLETDLRSALDDNQFHLVYQPVVQLHDRSVIGFEALVRWHHPERGLVSPGMFVPAAEETGIIVPLGWWILTEACQRMGDWARRYPSMNGMSVSVNLSGKQLRQPDLVDRVRGALAAANLDPQRLRLDVSERVLMDDPESNAAVLGRLRTMGVQVQVDDFGTGTSSLSYLNRFQVSSLKIDPSFVHGMASTGDQDAVVQAFITLAQRLGIHVVAEGVETDGQGDRLLNLHCDHGQGYLYSHPLPEEDVGRLLEARYGS